MPTFDPKCYALAKLFLEDEDDGSMDTEEHRNMLAGEIQTCIEDWLSDHRPRPDEDEDNTSW